MGHDQIERFSRLDSSSISDALDRLGIKAQPVGIRPLDLSYRACGPAYTVRYVPIEEGEPGSVGDFIDDVSPGSVVVIDNGGRLDCTVWGDLMTIVASRNRLGGTVIHGVCRDTPRALSLKYPLFARATFMRTGKDRVQLEAVQEPVSLGTHTVQPNDLIFGDADGVVVIPAGRSKEVLEAGEEIESAEEGIRKLLAEGLTLREARDRFGYHRLQSRP